MLHTPQSVYVIAEAGVNHNGDEKIAFKLVDIARDAGADAVKFQMFNPDLLVTKNAACADYQSNNLNDHTISQSDMLKKLTLPADAYVRLSTYCKQRHIDFICTPFDHESLNFLIQNTQMRYLKFSSGDLNNGPLLLAAARCGLPVVLSTGMADLDEIGTALSILYFGFTHATGYPERLAVATPAMLQVLSEKVIVLHCVSQYPAPVEATNLLAMDTLAEVFNMPVGFSDHSLGIELAIAASARGASMIEKHFTYDVDAPGPDHKASLTGEALKAMIHGIRKVSQAMGDGEKICRPQEYNTREVARKSLVAAENIAKGTCFSEANLTCKRPGPTAATLAPNHLWELIGKTAKRSYSPDDFIVNDELHD